MSDRLAVIILESFFLTTFIVPSLFIIFGKRGVFARVLANKTRDLVMFLVSAIVLTAFMARVWGVVFVSGFEKFVNFVSANIFPVIAVVFLTLLMIHLWRDIRSLLSS